jgi:neural Wiskott-Aldrich syndrome protein
MPSVSTLSATAKTKVKSLIAAPEHKIFYATLARVYYAPDGGGEGWRYSGMQGALVFEREQRYVCFRMSFKTLSDSMSIPACSFLKPMFISLLVA